MDEGQTIGLVVGALLGLIYFWAALWTKGGRGRAVSAGPQVVDVSVLARQSQRLHGLFGWRLLLPMGPGWARFIGLVLLLVGFTPVIFLMAAVLDQALAHWLWTVMPKPNPAASSSSDDKDFQNTVRLLIVGALLLLYFFSRILRGGWAMFRAPAAAATAGWEYEDWATITKRMPSENSLMVRDLPIRGGFLLYCAMAFSYVLKLLGFLFLVNLIFGGLLWTFLGLVFIAVSVWIRRQVAKRALARAKANEVLQPTVYLRGFKDDAPYASRIAQNSAITLEEALVMGLLTGGRPVVALGKPGEKLPALGATRFYATDEDWQQIVAEWIDKSFAIVMVATDTMATLWEKEQIFLREAFERFLILFAGNLETQHKSTVKTTKGNSFRLSSGGAGVPAWRLIDSAEQVTFARLDNLGVSRPEFKVLPDNYHLLGINFDGNRNATLFIAKRPTLEAYLEVIKHHVHKAEMQQGTANLLTSTLGRQALMVGLAVAGIVLALVALIGSVLGYYWHVNSPEYIVAHAMKEPWNRTVVQEGNASIEAPADWTVNDKTSNSDFAQGTIEPVVIKPASEDVLFRLTIIPRLALRDDLASEGSLADNEVSIFEGGDAQGTKKLDSEQRDKIGSLDSLSRLYTITNKDGEFSVRILTYLGGDFGIAATIVEPEGQDDAYRPLFDGLLGSFRIEPNPPALAGITSQLWNKANLCADQASVSVPASWPTGTYEDNPSEIKAFAGEVEIGELDFSVSPRISEPDSINSEADLADQAESGLKTHYPGLKKTSEQRSTLASLDCLERTYTTGDPGPRTVRLYSRYGDDYGITVSVDNLTRRDDSVAPCLDKILASFALTPLTPVPQAILQADWQTQTICSGMAKIDLPRDWKADPPKDYVAVFNAEFQGVSLGSLIVKVYPRQDVIPSITSVSVYEDLIFNALKKSNPDVKLLSEQPGKVATLDADERIYTLNDPEPSKLDQRCYFGNDYVIEVLYETTAHNFDFFAPVFQKVLDSFQLVTPQNTAPAPASTLGT